MDAGLFGQAVLDGWTDMAAQSHRDNPRLQRDKAIRSASLAAMILMLPAQGMGSPTGPMSGFDPETLSKGFDRAPHDLPVMSVATGYAALGNWPPKIRRPPQAVMAVV